MRKLNILKTLIDLFFFFAVLATLIMLVLIPLILCGFNELPIKINGEEISIFDWSDKVLLVFGTAGATCFTYSIYLFRKTIGYFVKRDLFNGEVVDYLDRIGQYLIASSLLTSIPLFIYNMKHRGKAELEFSTGFDSFLLSICLGLFFMVLSEVFKIAGKLKEENELTV